MNGTSPSRYPYDTTLPMALAVLLIVNSHLEEFHPRAWLAGDGLLGNNIFFLLSGLRMTSGRSRQEPFGRFMLSRFQRIYPAVWIATLCSLLVTATVPSPSLAVRLFIWPTTFTFIACILPFYAVLHLLLRGGRRAVAIGLGAATAAWLTLMGLDHSAPTSFSSVPVTINVLGYAVIYLVGALVALMPGLSRLPYSGICAVCLLPAYVIAKFVIVTHHTFQYYPVIHLLGILSAITLTSCLATPGFAPWFRGTPGAWRVTCFFAGHSLEIYVMHTFLLLFAALKRPVYPLNIMVFLALSLAAAALVKQVVLWVMPSRNVGVNS